MMRLSGHAPGIENLIKANEMPPIQMAGECFMGSMASNHASKLKQGNNFAAC